MASFVVVEVMMTCTWAPRDNTYRNQFIFGASVEQFVYVAFYYVLLRLTQQREAAARGTNRVHDHRGVNLYFGDNYLFSHFLLRTVPDAAAPLISFCVLLHQKILARLEVERRGKINRSQKPLLVCNVPRSC